MLLLANFKKILAGRGCTALNQALRRAKECGFLEEDVALFWIFLTTSMAAPDADFETQEKLLKRLRDSLLEQWTYFPQIFWYFIWKNMAQLSDTGGAF